MRPRGSCSPAFAGRLATLLLSAFALALPVGASAEPALPPGFQDEVVFANLEQPTSFAFAPDGRVFVAEKSGRIKVFDGLDDPTPDVFADLRTQTYDAGDRGLLALALDPEFDQGRPYVYALYAYDHILGDAAPAPKWGSPKTSGDPCPDLNGGDACLVSGRLVRLAEDAGSPNHAVSVGEAPVETPLLEGWCQQFSSHSVGDLRFGPEGALYVSGGDGASFTSADYGQLGSPVANPCGDPPSPAGTALSPPTAQGGALRAQNFSLLNGAILRIDPDTGAPFPGNPLAGVPGVGTNAERTVAKGFRNPFRFTFDAQTGEIYTGNVGSSEIEEIDRFAAPPSSVYNSGWPCYEGIERQFQFRVLELTLCENLYAAESGSSSKPFFSYSHGQAVVPDDECPTEAGSAVGGLAFYDGGEYPAAYEGSLFFADAVRGCIWVMREGEDGKPDPSTTVRFMRESKIYPGVEIEEGPDGLLYYASLFGNEAYGNGAIHRIVYEPGAPTARLRADPPYGLFDPAGKDLEIEFDAGASSDPDSQPLAFSWDMDGNGSFEDTAGGSTRTRTYTEGELTEAKENGESGNHVVGVRVEDTTGLSSVARITVYPGDKPPTVQIVKPAAGLRWGVGDLVKLDADAQDESGAAIDVPLGYYWSTFLSHCPNGLENCHEHPMQTFSGIRRPEFLAPEHDYPTYVLVNLRVADERGLTGFASLKLDPRTVDVTIASDPPGVELTAGLLQGSAPFPLTAIDGSHVLLSAPPAISYRGGSYPFSGWSDGGARIHTILAGEPRSYTASYAVPPAEPSSQLPPGAGSPPQTKLRAHPPKRRARPWARFAFASNQAGSRFRCRLDGRRYGACRSPVGFAGLKPGRHRFRVFAVGPTGLLDPTPATFSWRVLPPR